MSQELGPQGMSRRRFISATAAAAAVVASRMSLHRAWAASSTARYRRMNLAAPDFPVRILESYKTAVQRMLELPPEDPRNWYRNAIVHTLDCPHGNWWFLPWHRGYTGWFERTCRELSGDPEFALPYWDWTAEPRLPEAYFDQFLNPTLAPFLLDYPMFFFQFDAALQGYWASLTPAQRAQLDKREITTYAIMRDELQGYFADRDVARRPSLTPATPNLLQIAADSVVIEIIDDALAARDFVDFGSPKAAYHSEPIGFSVLEGFPHNKVHNDFEGFMWDMLSPVDPIFFMHHANIDRLWDVWTRKQLELGLPILPEGADLEPWSTEPFLFFIDPAGQPVTKNKAGDYAAIGEFDYDYQPGSGEAVLVNAAAKPSGGGQSFSASLDAKALSFTRAATGTVKVPAALLQAASGDAAGPTLVARISLRPSAGVKGARFHVLVNAPKDAANVSFESSFYAGTLEFFGTPHHVKGAVTFTVPLSKTLKALRRAGQLKTDEPLRIQVVADSRGVALKAFDSSLETVAVTSF